MAEDPAVNTDPAGGAPAEPIDVDEVKATITAELMTSLGVESIEELQAIISAKNEADDANKSEIQKANDKAKSFESQLQAKDNELLEARAKVSALKLGVDDGHLNDAIALAKIESSEDIQKGLEAVLERNPQFKGDAQTKTNPDGTSIVGANLGGGNSDITQEDFDKMTYEKRVELFNTNKVLYDSLNNK